MTTDKTAQELALDEIMVEFDRLVQENTQFGITDEWLEKFTLARQPLTPPSDDAVSEALERALRTMNHKVSCYASEEMYRNACKLRTDALNDLEALQSRAGQEGEQPQGEGHHFAEKCIDYARLSRAGSVSNNAQNDTQTDLSVENDSQTARADAVDVGMVLVPREPDQKMYREGVKAKVKAGSTASTIYRAMIAQHLTED